MMSEESQAIVDDIFRLHEDGDPVIVIAEKLLLPVSTVQHVIDHGEPPEAQPQWPID